MNGYCMVYGFDSHMRDFTGNYKLLFAKVVKLNFHAPSAHLQSRHIISTVCNVLQESPSVAVFFPELCANMLCMYT